MLAPAMQTAHHVVRSCTAKNHAAGKRGLYLVTELALNTFSDYSNTTHLILNASSWLSNQHWLVIAVAAAAAAAEISA
jgi:hypothetical protein